MNCNYLHYFEIKLFLVTRCRSLLFYHEPLVTSKSINDFENDLFISKKLILCEINSGLR